MLRDSVAKHQKSHGKVVNHPVVYVTRSPTAKRGVLNDDLLIKHVKKLFGKNLYVSTDLSMKSISLIYRRFMTEPSHLIYTLASKGSSIYSSTPKSSLARMAPALQT